MLDRTIAPAFVKIDHLNFKHAEQQHIKNIPVHMLRAGSQEVVKLEAVFKAGKWYEKSSGVAYFTSNMLREGTLNHDSHSISAILDKHGAHLDLTSTLDFSKVALYCLSKHLPDLAPLFFEMVEKAQFPDKPLTLLKEIEQQQHKIDMLKPKVQAQRIFRKVVFGDSPYGQSMDIDHIQNINFENIAEHYSSHYKNYELFVSGNFDKNELSNLVQDNASGNEGLDHQRNDLLNGYKHQIITKEIEGSLQSSLRLGFPFVSKDHEDYIPFQILNHTLGGYFGSRLMKNIREDKGYTYGIYSSVASMKNSGYFVIATDVVKESAEKAVEEILREIDLLKEEEIPLNELETVKNHIVGSFQADITSPFALMDMYKSVYLNNLDYSYYEKYFEVLNEIRPGHLRDLAIKYFDRDNLSIVRVG